MTENCYIHIPFCKSKCNYCAFVSFPCLDKITAYVYALLKEINERYSGEPLKTLYFGGGTPSLLPINLFEKIIRKFNLANDAEVTIELNPDDVTEELVAKYIDLGVNRFSLGLQSFDDDILKICGRRHNSVVAINAIKAIKAAGGTNISGDLIYGLPSQSIACFKKDLEILVAMPVTHISLYGLKIEEGTPFFETLPKELPDEDLQADMYIVASEFLKEKGFLQYEISNFAKVDCESRHNLNYWDNNSYYGFGLSAHGYVDGFRYYNSSDMEVYLEKPHISEYAHHVTKQECLEEEIFLGMRRVGGINIPAINKKFDIDFMEKYSCVIEKYVGEFIEISGSNIKFTTKGFMLSNVILAEFI